MKKHHEMAEAQPWVAPRRLLSSSGVSSPVLSPANQDGEPLLFMRDKGYALHGEILMLVLVFAFSLFLVVLVALPYLKRNRDLQSGYSDSIDEEQRNYCHVVNLWLRKKRTVDDEDAPGECLQRRNQISRKFPL